MRVACAPESRRASAIARAARAHTTSTVRRRQVLGMTYGAYFQNKIIRGDPAGAIVLRRLGYDELLAAHFIGTGPRWCRPAGWSADERTVDLS